MLNITPTGSGSINHCTLPVFFMPNDEKPPKTRIEENNDKREAKEGKKNNEREAKEGKCISNFDVKDEQTTKTEYEGLWGESHSNKWGED